MYTTALIHLWKKAINLSFFLQIDSVNQAIKSATESFNDPKIQYIDIDPAFQDHRFCEPGHSYWDQLKCVIILQCSFATANCHQLW